MTTHRRRETVALAFFALVWQCHIRERRWDLAMAVLISRAANVVYRGIYTPPSFFLCGAPPPSRSLLLLLGGKSTAVYIAYSGGSLYECVYIYIGICRTVKRGRETQNYRQGSLNVKLEARDIVCWLRLYTDLYMEALRAVRHKDALCDGEFRIVGIRR